MLETETAEQRVTKACMQIYTVYIYAAIHLYVHKISAYNLPWGQIWSLYHRRDVAQMPHRHTAVYNCDIIAFNWKTFMRCERENKYHNLYVCICALGAEILMLIHLLAHINIFSTLLAHSSTHVASNPYFSTSQHLSVVVLDMSLSWAFSRSLFRYTTFPLA